ncbi:MAG: HD domain-containing protein [Verrucomicrobiota bacterium]
MKLTSKFEQALSYTLQAHAQQVRKGSGTPYFAHLMGVAAIALENGATEDEAIGALLHDAVEDQGGQPRLRDIERRFGPVVADIVAGCSDTDVVPKPPWAERKRLYLAEVSKASDSVQFISAADKLYNARAILTDYRAIGDAVWSRFKGGKAGTLWYYRGLAGAYTSPRAKSVVDELKIVVSELEEVANGGRAETVLPEPLG